MGVESMPFRGMPIWPCQYRGCDRGVRNGYYFCDEHRTPGLKQSEPVSKRLGTRNALVMTGECYVYAIDGGDLVKIGKAMDVEERFSALRTASPVELTLLGSVRGPKTLEREVHAWAAPHRKRGEWFEKAAPFMAVVSAIVAGDLALVQRLIKKA